MPSFLTNFNTRQIILIGGFIFILISIPASFLLLKDTQIFKSRANFEAPKNLDSTSSAHLKAVPNSSPLEDLRKLLEASSSGNSSPDTKGAASSSPTPTPPVTTASFGQTLSFKITMEGRTANNQSGKIFVGIALGATKIKPTYLLTFSVDLPASGSFSGLSLAGLTVGSQYTAYIKGPSQIDAATTFTMSAAETQLNQGNIINLTSGDVNEDNTINSNDYNLVVKAYGSTPKSANWNARADINGDGVVNYYDLGLVNKNIGKTGDSGVWQSTPPLASGSAQINSTSPQGGYWMRVP